MLSPTAAPHPSESTQVGDALAAHYVAHQLPADGGAMNPWLHVRIGPLTVRLPNPPARRRSVLFHDVNHMVTGYNTTFSDGEVVIAGFEVGAGCGPFWIVWYINLSMLALGLALRPRDVFAAFVRGRRSSSFYRCRTDPTTLAGMSLGAVRSLLELDCRPLNVTTADRVAFAAWAIVAVAVLLGPLAVPIAAGWAVIRVLR